MFFCRGGGPFQAKANRNELMSSVNGDALRGVLVALVVATAVCGVAMVLALLAVSSPPGAITVLSASP